MLQSFLDEGVIYILSSSAYDEKQHQKREEISTRSLFEVNDTKPLSTPSSSTQKGSKSECKTSEIERVKNKLQLAVKNSKTAGKNTFNNSNTKNNSLKTAADFGIVTKSTKTTENTELQSPGLTGENEKCDLTEASDFDNEAVNSNGLKSLFTNYDSTSNSDSCGSDT